MVRKIPPSLNPGPSVIEAAAEGQPEAVAIRDAWRFNHPIRTVPPEEFYEIAEKGYTTFHG